MIIEATHFMKSNEIYPKGKYLISEIYDINNPQIYFEGMNKIK